MELIMFPAFTSVPMHSLAFKLTYCTSLEIFRKVAFLVKLHMTTVASLKTYLPGATLGGVALGNHDLTENILGNLSFGEILLPSSNFWHVLRRFT